MIVELLKVNIRHMLIRARSEKTSYAIYIERLDPLPPIRRLIRTSPKTNMIRNCMQGSESVNSEFPRHCD
jgi:hypothetical protein